MSHHNSIQVNVPKRKLLKKQQQPVLKNIPVEDKNELLIAGQGCITFKIAAKTEKATVTFTTPKGEQVVFSIDKNHANFQYRMDDTSALKDFELVNPDTAHINPKDKYTEGIDKNEACLYWISIDNLNKRLLYGKGEMRPSTALLDFQYDTPLNLFTKDNKEKYPFIGQLKTIQNSNEVEPEMAWKDPVVAEPPTSVVPAIAFTMDDAAKTLYATPASLSPECQTLYGNVADFELNTPDFPDFEQALEYSIRTEGCIGYEIIKYKLEHGEFGDTSGDLYKEVYLRITLGQSQGESPGIPYVMEIWPAGCGSPIHHHGYTHAIIKVLRGEIDVDLYRMLPMDNKNDLPLQSVSFREGEITYIMPEVNQFHRLKNNLKNTDTCITIQCYAYSRNDDVHYATFDYVENNELGHFDPISDYDFLAFKAKVKEEWEKYLSQRFWSTYKPKVAII